MTEKPLMRLRPKTNYEKLLWQRLISKTLREKNSLLEKEKANIQRMFNELKNSFSSSSKGQLMRRNMNLVIADEIRTKKLRDYKARNDELMTNLVRLQTTGSINRKVDEEAAQHS